MNRKEIALLVATFLTLSSCQDLGKKNKFSQEEVSVNETPFSFMMSMLSGTFDELAAPTSQQCGKANGQNCQSGVGSNTFQQIEYKKTSPCKRNETTVIGKVTLDSNRSDCKLPITTTDFTVLSEELTHNNAQTGLTTTYSSLRKTSGTSIGVGGGVTLSIDAKFNQGYIVNVNGVHRMIQNKEKKILSDQTLTAVGSLKVATTDFSQSSRLIATGSVLAINNILGDRIIFTFKNLTWKKADCCFPTSGFIESLNSSSPSSEKSLITFLPDRCGFYSETFSDGQVKTDTLTNCGGSVN